MEETDALFDNYVRSIQDPVGSHKKSKGTSTNLEPRDWRYLYYRTAIVAVAAILITALVCAGIAVPTTHWLGIKKEAEMAERQLLLMEVSEPTVPTEPAITGFYAPLQARGSFQVRREPVGGNTGEYVDVEYGDLDLGFAPTPPTTGLNASRRVIARDWIPLQGECGPGLFKCVEGCVDVTLRCNKVRDCADGHDEVGCTCADYLALSSQHKICDGYSDCPDESDELFCPNKCTPSQFECPRGRHCIESALVCNGALDCADGEDETDCVRLAPTIELASIQQYYDEGYLLVRRQGTWYYSCENSVNPTFWQDACHVLGYDGLVGTGGEYRPIPRGSSAFSFVSFFGNAFLSTQQSGIYANTELKQFCESTNPVYLKCSQLRCGIAPVCQPSRARIVGGRKAGLSCFPWAAALYSEGKQRCMAVLLDHNWLVTAAHCFKDASLRAKHWTARMGFTRQQSQSPFEAIRRIEQVILHPSYKHVGMETNDVALIRLDLPVRYSDYLRPACLHDFPQQDLPRVGSHCTVYGWGYQNEGDELAVDELQQVSLRVMSQQRCNSSGPFRGKINAAHLCLSHGATAKDACQGDSGGPLVCRDRSGMQYLAGITSTGYGCARKNVPGIWTRLAYFAPWIKQTLANPVGGFEVVPPTCAGFRCRLGECIFRWFRCDYSHDCPVDGSDEMGCGY